MPQVVDVKKKNSKLVATRCMAGPPTRNLIDLNAQSMSKDCGDALFCGGLNDALHPEAKNRSVLPASCRYLLLAARCIIRERVRHGRNVHAITRTTFLPASPVTERDG